MSLVTLQVKVTVRVLGNRDLKEIESRASQIVMDALNSKNAVVEAEVLHTREVFG